MTYSAKGLNISKKESRSNVNQEYIPVRADNPGNHSNLTWNGSVITQGLYSLGDIFKVPLVSRFLRVTTSAHRTMWTVGPHTKILQNFSKNYCSHTNKQSQTRMFLSVWWSINLKRYEGNSLLMNVCNSY